MEESIIEKHNKVVVRFKDNRIIKGTVLGWAANKPSFFVEDVEVDPLILKWKS